MSDKKNILIVEDSKSQAEILNKILSQEGYVVTSAKDGLEGLYVLMNLRPDLIISDVWMPNMNGYKFCRTLKDDVKLQDIPVVLLTSLSDTGYIVQGLVAGADYYLTKPYSENLLLSTVDSILSNPEMYTGGKGQEIFEIKTKDKIVKASIDPQHILNFLFSTYENLRYENRSLVKTKDELRMLNNNLEAKIKEKTYSLEMEVEQRKYTQETLHRALNGTVAALSTAVEMRDPYTAGHQLRVSRLGCAIAAELGLPEEQIEGMRVMGFLHDIGKIIVPAEILSKPSKLTDYEFRFIKEHSQAGYDILKGIAFPWPVATAVVQHHERLNGSGYPSGLAGDKIILEARIIGVADVIESMASHRPYRPALGIGKALDEVVQNKGILYDPDVVNSSLKLFQEKRFSFEE
ncbi:MAG: response regulator [Proteobacteria bacterium]|nr:response regulator [Pseudomonadota bacterium]